jgi:hypothetical protein
MGKKPDAIGIAQPGRSETSPILGQDVFPRQVFQIAVRSQFHADILAVVVPACFSAASSCRSSRLINSGVRPSC